MRFELLTAALYSWSYNDKEVDKICTKLNGTIYEKRINIVSQFNKYLERTEKKVFIDINSLEELKELSNIFNINIIIDFGEEPPFIVIYDGYIE